MKVPQVKPDWKTGIYIGDGVVAKPEYPDPAERYEDLHREEREFEKDFDEWLDDE